MEGTTQSSQPAAGKDNAVIFYILGGVVVTAIIVAGFLLFPKNSPPAQNQPVLGQQTEQATTPPTATPVPKGPIGSLACVSQFYNTVNGVAEHYYISTEGEAPQAAGSVTCTITMSVNNQIVATETMPANSYPVPARGGFMFRCSTPGLKLKPGVPTKVTSDLKDANGNSASCNRTFLLPG